MCIILLASSWISCSDLHSAIPYNKGRGRWESNWVKDAQQNLLKSKTDQDVVFTFPDYFFIQCEHIRENIITHIQIK